MYKAKLSGSTANASGKVYRFTAGKTVEGAEKGELDHCESVEWVNETKQASTKAEPQSDSEYPIHKGAGYYELSNGESVRGKDEAIEAEKELNA